MSHYRLLALDIDGTVADQDGQVIPSAVEAAQLARQKGLRVALVTGRMTCSARPTWEMMELTDPLVSYNGARVTDFQANQVSGWLHAMSGLVDPEPGPAWKNETPSGI